jgi:hypothetical protein
MNEACRRYAEDPEANAAHLSDCLACRQIYALLDSPLDSQPVRVEALPLAGWEGAGYRAWPLVLGGALALLAVAFALCAAARISPLQAVLSGMSTSQWRSLIFVAADGLRAASPVLQVLYGVGFVVVNTILILLLRRAPRGIDA